MGAGLGFLVVLLAYVVFGSTTAAYGAVFLGIPLSTAVGALIGARVGRT
jgi:hypothetical protein